MTSVSVDSATQVSATIPSGVTAGTYDITLTNSNGKSATSSNGFILLAVGQSLPTPNIKSVAPKTIKSGKENTVVIMGFNFLSGAKVYLDGNNLTTITVNSAEKITMTVPSTQSRGSYTVKVTNSDGQSATRMDALAVTDSVKLLVSPNNPSG